MNAAGHECYVVMSVLTSDYAITVSVVSACAAILLLIELDAVNSDAIIDTVVLSWPIFIHTTFYSLSENDSYF